MGTIGWIIFFYFAANVLILELYLCERFDSYDRYRRRVKAIEMLYVTAILVVGLPAVVVTAFGILIIYCGYRLDRWSKPRERDRG